MKRMLLMFLIPALWICSCKGSKDVLAVYSGGVVERGELEEWSKARNINPDKFMKDPKMKETILRQVVAEKIIYVMACEAGYEKDPDAAIVKETVYRNFLSSYYFNIQSQNPVFNETSAEVSIIRLFFKGAEGGAEYKTKLLMLENEIIPALKKGSDFSMIAKQYSEDSAKKKGGKLGFVLPGMLEKDMEETVASLHEGEYSAVPVRISNSLCIVKVDRRAVISNENIGNIIADKGNSDRIIAFIKRREIAASGERLKTKSNVVSRLDKAVFKADKEVLFSINGRSYTTGYIKSILKVFYILKKNEIVTDYSTDEIRFTASRVLNEILAASEAEKLGYQNDREFADKWKYIERSAFTGMYKSRYLLQNVIITDKEIEDVYRSKLLSRKNSKSGKNRITRQSVRSQLYKMRFIKLKNDWEAGLLRENNFAIR